MGRVDVHSTVHLASTLAVSASLFELVCGCIVKCLEENPVNTIFYEHKQNLVCQLLCAGDSSWMPREVFEVKEFLYLTSGLSEQESVGELMVRTDEHSLAQVEMLQNIGRKAQHGIQACSPRKA